MPAHKCPSCFEMLVEYPNRPGMVCPRCGYVMLPAAPRPIPKPGNTQTAYVAGIDLGKLTDFTAFAGLRKTTNAARDESSYEVVSLHRFDIGTLYKVIAKRVATWMNSAPWTDAPLAADRTGVGVAVTEMLTDAGVPRMIPVTITSGLRAVEQQDGSWHVAKIELVSVLQALLGTERLGIAKGLPFAEILVKELKTFKSEITKAGNETFESWRERGHDDLVLSVAMACFIGENGCLGGAWDATPHPASRGIVDKIPRGVFLNDGDDGDDNPTGGRTLWQAPRAEWPT